MTKDGTPYKASVLSEGATNVDGNYNQALVTKEGKGIFWNERGARTSTETLLQASQESQVPALSLTRDGTDKYQSSWKQSAETSLRPSDECS